MDRASKTEIIQALKEVALEASTLYSDEPLDYKKRPVTPKGILETGDSFHNVEVVLATAKNSRGRKILDVGIAYGIYDVVLKRRFGFEICGIDHPENVNVYCKFPIREGITVLSCDLHRDVIPYPEGSFDTVIASEVAEHLLIPPKPHKKWKKHYLIK